MELQHYVCWCLFIVPAKPILCMLQVLVVVTASWDVLCFDHNLRLQWTARVKVRQQPTHSYPDLTAVFPDHACPCDSSAATLGANAPETLGGTSVPVPGYLSLCQIARSDCSCMLKPKVPFCE